MCVLAFAWKVHPHWPLVLAGNRDERHDRPAGPLQRWTEDPRVLAGRDLTAGGSWLGVSERGVLATVTNIPKAGQVDGRPSRGWLVRDVLLGGGDYARPDLDLVAAFNPMNLIVIDRDEAQFWSNWPEIGLRRLPPGLYGLANETLDHPEPRTDRLKAGLARWLDGGAARLEDLMTPLADRGAPGERGTFLVADGYGTRCSTVVQVSAKGEGDMLERRFGPGGVETGETLASFVWG